MRTTLTIDDDLLSLAAAIARNERRTVSSVVSEHLRKSMATSEQPLRYRNGIPLLPVGPNARRATLELVNRLRDETE